MKKYSLLLILIALFSFGARATQTPVTLTSDGNGGWYINMPVNGTATTVDDAAVLTLTADDLAAGKHIFKVYDEGGKNGDYTNSYNGYLIITAPTGYRIQLNGTVYTETCCDYLRIYDGTTTSDASLGEYKEGTVNDKRSTAESVLFYFHSDFSQVRWGFDITAVTFTENSLVTIDGVNGAYDYPVSNFSYSVKDIDGNVIDPSYYTTSFTLNGNPVASVEAVGNYVMTVVGDASHPGTLSKSFAVLSGNLSGAGTETNPYLINNSTDWNTFVDHVNNGYSYVGEYVRLESNITVTTMAGNSSDNSFQGTFLGNDKTLTFNYTATEDICAPFRYIKNATISNLTVAGAISTGYKYGAGLAGNASGTNNITDCESAVEITSTFTSNMRGYHSGFVAIAMASSTTNFTNCVFAGKLLGSNAYGNAGFASMINGSGTVVINNCLFAPTEITMNSSSSYVFGNTNNNGNCTFNGAFYTSVYGNTGSAIQVYSGPQTAFCKKEYTYNATDYYSKLEPAINVTEAYLYTGSEIPVTFSVKYNNVTLTEVTDYTYTINPSPVLAVGTYTITITGEGNFAGTATKTFDVMQVLPGQGDEEHPYLISDNDDWLIFVENVNHGNTYSGKFIKLVNDITVTTPAGTGYSYNFQGTFNGNNNTMTLDMTNTNSSIDNYAPFKAANGATIKNLNIAGQITSNGQFMSSLIGYACGGTIIIQNCVSTATINCTRDGEGLAGSFIGYTNYADFNHCVFAGKLLGANASRNGGFIGYYNYSSYQQTFNNCMFIPTEVTMKDSNSYTFTPTTNNIFNNTYYLTPFGTAQGTLIVTTVPVNEVYKAVVAADNNSYYAIVDITGVNELYKYTGSVVSVTPVVKFGSTTLTAGTNYTATIRNSSNVVVDPSELIATGDYTYTIEGVGDYAGTRVLAFSIINGESINGYVFETGTDDEGTYYKINNAADFERLAACVASTSTGVTSGLRFKQTADITINAMIGTSNSYTFQGIYDGQNHSMTMNFNTDLDYCAPFKFIKNATIKNLVTAGTITTSARYAASIASMAYGTTNIQNCTSTVEITSTRTSDYEGYHGGLVSYNQGDVMNISNCVFAGKLLGEYASNNAGFVYYNNGTMINYTDCLFAPAEITMSSTSSATFNRNGNNTFTRTYYLTQYGEAQGVYVNTTAPATVYKQVTAADTHTYYISCDVVGVESVYLYTGSAIDVTPVVTYLGEILTVGTDYTVTISPATVLALGEYTMTIAGTGNYTGTKTFNFRIVNGADLDGYAFETATDNEGTYYVIADESDLERLAAYVNSEHTAQDLRFKQTADITMTAEHTAIGRNTSSKYFKGIYDGDGKNITNLYINKTGSGDDDQYQGLFGYTYYSTVKNVNIVNCNITGYYETAGVVGYNYYGTVSNCTVSGKVQKAAGQTPNNIAGVVGYSYYGTVTDCVNHATVNGHSYVGGISGDCAGTISNCINDGVVTGVGFYIGSIASRNNASFINNYYPAGLGLIGGVGQSSGTTGVDIKGAEVMFTITEGDAATHITTEPVKVYNATNYYANGKEIGLSYDVPTGKFFDKYTVSLGTITNPYNIDGTHVLAGVDDNVTITGSYTDKMDISNEIVSVYIGTVPYTGEVITVSPLVTRLGETLVQGTDYTVATNPATVQAAGDYTMTITGIGNFTGSREVPFKVSEAIVINNAEDWNAFAANVNAGINCDGYYKLGDSFDNTTAVTTTVGTTEHPFIGVFEGNNKTLNVNIEETSTNGTAPFREIAGATIKNLTVSGSVNGKSHAAGLVGFTRSGVNFIDNCVVNTNVTCTTGYDRYIGGVVGHGVQATLNISNTVYTGTFNNSWYFAGGLLGWSNGSTLNITNCLVTGGKTGNDFHPIAIRSNGAVMNVTVNGAFYTMDPTLTNTDYIAATGIKVYEGAQTQFCHKECTFNEIDYYSKKETVLDVVDIYQYTGSEITVNPTVTYDGTALTADTDYTISTDPTPLQEIGTYTLIITGNGDYAGTQSTQIHVVSDMLPGSGTETDPFLISSSEDWNKFAGNINNGSYAYTGKFVKLDADIEVTTMAGNSQDNSFQGVFDGDSHTMTLNLTATNQISAPFRYLNNATVKYLNIAGTITSGYRYAASLAGYVYGTTNIQNCTSSAEIVSTYENADTEGDYGGFVAYNTGSAKLYFTNCVFTGKLLGANAIRNGGFLGFANNYVYYTDCLFAPAEITMSDTESYTYNRNNGYSTFTRAYYLTQYGTAQGIYVVETIPADDVYTQVVAADANTYNALCVITGVNDLYMHTGSAVAVTPVVKLGNTTLTKDTDYTLTIKNNVNVIVAPEDLIDNGDYTITVAGAGDYAGSKVFAFRIVTGESINGYVFETGTDDEGTYYKINNTADFERLKACVESSNDVTSGKRFKQTADIAVSTMMGTSEYRSFQGVYDGQSHTMTLSITINSDYTAVAPFKFMKNATIKNLTVDGTITGGQYSASISAYSYGTSNIQNCNSSVEINTCFTSSTNGSYGGFVGEIMSSATLNISNCMFAGKLLGNNAHSNAGFVGYNGGTMINYTNCLLAPAEITMNEENSATFNRNGKNTFTNSYYLTQIGQAQGIHVIASATGVYKAVVAVDNNTYYAPCDITNVKDLYAYTGSAIAVEPVVTFDNETLTQGTDYTLTFTPSDDILELGDYTLTVVGTGDFAGSHTYAFSVVEGEDLDGYVFMTGNDGSKYYVIANEADLQRLAAYVNSGHNGSGKRFKQTDDITLTEAHTAIGTESARFNGTFDGDNKTISGLVINKPNATNQGLFGYAYSATVKNVVIVNCDITAKNYAGGLIGYGYDTNVSYCSVSGAVKTPAGISASYHGGIVGYLNWYSIINCVNTASVTGNGAFHGGIVGYKYHSSIVDCINAGTVEGTSYVGSIVGYVESATITNNYHTPSTTGGIGSNGSATGTDQNGAEALFSITTGTNTTLTSDAFFTYQATNYYKNGDAVTLEYNVPAGMFFEEYTVSNGTITNPYIIDGTHILNDVTEGNVTVTGVSSNKMDIASGAVTVYIPIIPYTGNVITVNPVVKRLDVTLVKDVDYTMATVPATVQAVGNYTMTITGIGNYTGTRNANFTVSEATEIHNATDWNTFAANVNAGTGCDGYYKLADDFDNTTAITTTVGTTEHPFTGLFDGNGKTLNVNISETSTYGTAPFREIAGATIRNLTVSGSVNGTTHAAGLVGFTRSGVNHIENCVVNTNVTCNTGSSRHIGGVVGHGIQATINISNTVYTGTFSNNSYAGGLLGWNDGATLNITNCLVTGGKTGSNFHPIAIKNNGVVMTVSVNGAFYTMNPTLTNTNYIGATGVKVYSGAQTAFCKKEYTFNETNYYSKEATVIDNVEDTYEYTGSAITVTPAVTYAGTALTEGETNDYTFAFTPATVQAVGTYTVTITGKGIYAGTQSLEFHVISGILPGSGTEADPYLIASTDDWNKFAGNINDGAYTYSGCYVKLMDDITITTMAGVENNGFAGNFNGNNKTITLSFPNHSYTLASGENEGAQGIALFNYVGNGCNIHDLNVDGVIVTANKFAASIIAYIRDGQSSSNKKNVTLANCHSSVSITSTVDGDATTGGLVAISRPYVNLTVSHCIFDGAFISSTGKNISGLVGYQNNSGTTNITDCLVNADITGLTTPNGNFRTICRYGGTVNMTRAYYITAIGTAQGKHAYAIADVPATPLFGLITATDGNTYYVEGSVGNIESSYAYTGNVININPTYSISNESVTFVKDTDFEVAITYNGNPVTEVNEIGDYVFTLSAKAGGKCSGTYTKNVNVYGSAPTDLACTTTSVSATFTWNDNLATDWTIEISQSSNFNTIDATQDVDVKTATFNGLIPESQYYARVKAMYGTTAGNWSSTYGFMSTNAIVINKNSGTSSNVPTNMAYNYSMTQQIYTAEEIGRSGNILNVDFMRQSGSYTASTRNIDIYMKNTDKSVFSSDSDWVNMTESDKVFSGEVNFTFESDYWKTIVLDTPFAYDNTKNLAILVKDNTGVAATGIIFMAPDIDINRSLRIYGNVNYDPSNATSYTGNRSEWRSAIRLRMGRAFTTAGEWDVAANWTPAGVPTATEDVSIVANANINNNVVAEANAIIFRDGKTLTVKDGGQLKHNNTDVKVNVEKHINGYGTGDDNWYLIASPWQANNVTLNDDNAENLIATTASEYDLFRFNYASATGEWLNYKKNSFNLENGAGYLYANKNTVDITFKNNTVKRSTVAVEKSLAYTANGTQTFNGWNLIGNPFVCNVYIDRPYYMMNAAGTTLIAVEAYSTTPIAPSTGVMVLANTTGEKVTFNREAPVTVSNNGSLNIVLTNGGTRANTVIDNAIVSFNSDSKLGKFVFNEDNAKLYIPQDGDDYAIVYSDRQGEMPLNFSAREIGTYTISFSSNNTTLDGVRLIDKIEGKEIDLSVESSYTFMGSASDRDDRFTIVFTNNNSNFAYQDGDQIIVSGNGELQIFDVTGRFVMSTHVNGVQTIAKPAQNGVYILRLLDSEIKTQKIVVR